MKILIVGGVAGGATTAARLRRNDENCEIVMFERGKYISYANCGLPYYIGGTIQEREKLFVQTPEAFGKRFNIDIRIMSEVTAIDPEKKEVSVKNLETGNIYQEQFDKLVLSPGAEPLRPNLPGIKSEGIFTLRNVNDTDQIKEFIESRKPKKAVVVGAGFIGLEMAENLHKLGMQVTIVEMAEQVMTPLDYSMASLVHQHLKTKNVEFYLKDGVSRFEKTESKLSIMLMSGRKIESELIILSIGVRPENQLAKNGGLTIGESGGIFVNEYLQTSYPDIYAVGDAIEFTNPITQKRGITYLAGPANKQGRIAADNIIFGNTHLYKGSISTAIAKVFDLTVASAGVSGRTLKKEQIPYISSITHSSSHAGYYPNAIPMTIKIVFSPENGRLFGAQVVGYEGVDKRLDLLATVIKNNGTVYDLTEIEHAYAPPYSSAKDPVNIAGFVAENILKGKVKIATWRNLINYQQNDFILVDVRTHDEFQLGTIEGAINIPLDDIRQRLNEFPKNKKILIFCGVGLRGYLACRILSQLGFEDIYNLSGGYKTYEFAVQKQSNEDIYENNYIGIEDHIYQGHQPIKNTQPKTVNELDACGLQCPRPIMKLKSAFEKAIPGQIIKVSATDPAFGKDAEAWCRVTGNKLLKMESFGGKVIATVQKEITTQNAKYPSAANGKTLIVFSDDLDKALASFVIANGASAMGKKVTMFFTFWGLNIIKKQIKPHVNRNLIAKLFDFMLPSDSTKLKLSKMNMFGMGSKMMRSIMHRKNIDSLESLMQQAKENDIEMIACNMSMEVMGISKEELLDHISIGGVASYLERAEEANVNLFV